MTDVGLLLISTDFYQHVALDSATSVVGDGDLFHLHLVDYLHLPVWQHAHVLAQCHRSLWSVVSFDSLVLSTSSSVYHCPHSLLLFSSPLISVLCSCLSVLFVCLFVCLFVSFHFTYPINALDCFPLDMLVPSVYLKLFGSLSCVFACLSVCLPACLLLACLCLSLSLCVRWLVGWLTSIPLCLSIWLTSSGGRVLSVFSWKNGHKLRKVYWIWQVMTIRSINHNVGALKELICRM